jgi:hypothetical protein
MFIAGHGINKVTVKILIIKILTYSAIKIKANLLLLYSILNPDTSSDSPSDRSKGVRLVSAKRVMNQSNMIGNKNKIAGLVVDREEKLNDKVFTKASKQRRIKAILISYEIVWAILRSAPNKEYLELEDHPASKIVYTFNLDRHKKKIILKGIKNDGKLCG